MDEILNNLRQSVIDGMREPARAQARQALEYGLDPLFVVNNSCVPAMDFVGQKFGCHEMYLPDVIAASEAMKAAMSVLEPEMRKRGSQRESLGRVVLGTVKGDIHEIGKSLVGILLSANGFEVHDLGINVPAEIFVTKAQELGADIVGLSALLTTTMVAQRTVVEAFDRAALRPKVKVVVGGAPVTRQWAQDIGADGYARDATTAVTLVRSLIAPPASGRTH